MANVVVGPDTFQPVAVVPPAHIESRGTIVVVTFYGFKNPIGCACRALSETLQWNVIDFPMYRYKMDAHDATENWMAMFCNTVKQVGADAVLFWFHSLEPINMQKIRQQVDSSVPFIVYNWDDPYCWENNKDFAKTAAFFDGALTSCRDSVQNYIDAHATISDQSCAARYCLPCFDTHLASLAIEKHSGPHRFSCDIMFLTTNIYENESLYPNQRINRAKLLDAIYKQHCAGRLVFHLYGPESLKERYPRSYQKLVNYEELYEVKRTARIVLTTHVSQNQSYCNERTCVALGCGALMLSDLLPDIDHLDCQSQEEKELQLVYDTGDTIDSALAQIDQILKMPYTESERVREVARNQALKQLTWQDWAKCIERVVGDLLVTPDEQFAQQIQHKYLNKNSDNAGEQSILAKNINNVSHQSTTRSLIDRKSSRSLHVNDPGLNHAMPGYWNVDDHHNYAKPIELKDYGQDDEEREVQAQMQTAVFANSIEPDNIEAVPYTRQRELASMFDNIAQSEDFEQHDKALRSLVSTMEKNPDLEVTTVLHHHWQRTDQ